MDLKDTLSMLIGLWGDTGILGMVSLDLSGGYLFVFVCAILGCTLFVLFCRGFGSMAWKGTFGYMVYSSPH